MNRMRAILLALAAAAATTIVAAAHAESYRVLYAFRNDGDGAFPNGSLVDFGGKLYGTAGGSPRGVVFSLDPMTGAEATVYAFQQGFDGVGPVRGMIAVGGRLYGATRNGGTRGYGTLFSFDPATGVEAVVHSFAGGKHGSEPAAGPTLAGGRLFGTTSMGGAFRGGLVYSVDPALGGERSVYSFRKDGVDGNVPLVQLLKHLGVLYGTTASGGAHDKGTVFALDPRTGSETVLYSFRGGDDGSNPDGDVVHIGDTLYGATALGGAASLGTIFSLDLDTGIETTVYSFKGNGDGIEPNGGLLHMGSFLYGTTLQGGAAALGTLFSFNLRTGVETVLHSFQGGGDGDDPDGDLIDFGGTLYGATGGTGNGAGGCTRSCGTLFAFTP